MVNERLLPVISYAWQVHRLHAFSSPGLYLVARTMTPSRRPGH